MKKIPTLFERVFEHRKIVGISDKITPGCEEAFLNGIATVKYDGSCCAIFDGIFYKRYDAKKGKEPPEGAIPCCDPDPITGHWPHWVPVKDNDPADKWFIAAYIGLVSAIKFNNMLDDPVQIDLSDPNAIDGTYEAVGPHFNGNPHNLVRDMLIPHGQTVVDVGRTFDDVMNYLHDHDEEGLVFWYEGKPVCKIKRTDFGFEWPIKVKGQE